MDSISQQPSRTTRPQEQYDRFVDYNLRRPPPSGVATSWSIVRQTPPSGQLVGRRESMSLLGRDQYNNNNNSHSYPYYYSTPGAAHINGGGGGEGGIPRRQHPPPLILDAGLSSTATRHPHRRQLPGRTTIDEQPSPLYASALASSTTTFWSSDAAAAAAGAALATNNNINGHGQTTRQGFLQQPFHYLSSHVTFRGTILQQKQAQLQQQQPQPVGPSWGRSSSGQGGFPSSGVDHDDTAVRQHQLSQSLTTATAVAADAAKEAPMAGFLYKLGMNVPEYKRRFFILQPGTYLYYFLSPTDTTPRGCLDLEGSWLEEYDEEVEGPDGRQMMESTATSSTGAAGRFTTDDQQRRRYRFAIVWENGRRVVLEARTKEMARSWMKALQEERLPHYKSELSKSQRKVSAMSSRIKELEQVLGQYRLIEKDRDGAVEDAAQWKSQFYQLDESIRRLTQQIRKPVGVMTTEPTTAYGCRDDEHTAAAATTSTIGEPPLLGRAAASEAVYQEYPTLTDGADGEGSILGVGGALSDVPSGPVVLGERRTDDADVAAVTPSRDTSLLDEAVEQEEENEAGMLIEVAHVPGVHFSGLHNACEQLRASLRLASEEAATAVDDLTLANAKADTLEKKMLKAEKHICKLWEENVSLRKALKQKKREKRVLVREVKNFMSAAAEKRANKDDAVSLMLMQQPPPDDCSSVNGGVSDNEERLIDELEEHVLSSIRLHEQFLASSSPNLRPRRPSAVEDVAATGGAENNKRRSPAVSESTHAQDSNGAPRSLLSLFEDESDSESEENSDAVGQDGDKRIPSAGASISSSVEVQVSENEQGGTSIGPTKYPFPPMDGSPASANSTPERKNPVELLDYDEEEASQPQLYAISSQSESSKSVITNTGEATTKLACPMADVVNTKGTSGVTPADPNDLQVYHLTFYSKKIGLQFQKVPPPPARAKGLLTEAMTADLVRAPTGSDTTVSELRRIAAFSSSASEPRQTESNSSCPVATPLDAVLVCGFVGFDDSGSNVRPRLGARLVAFDGVSVEVGQWTFESIRKSIQARSRPLTLSFRNDFLTTEQRRLLTKATKEVERAAPAPAGQPTVEYRHNQSLHHRRPSVDPSVQSGLSSETEHVLTDGLRTPILQDDEYSSSAAGSDYRHYGVGHSFSGARSFSSSAPGNTFYSFSEAGSSASVLSAVAPLVHNLLSKRRSNEPFTPEYLRREPQSVEQTPQHQDFKSELL